MAVGKSRSHRKPASSSKKTDKSETYVNVAEYQKLGDRQLDALLSQNKIHVEQDTDCTGKIRALIDFQVSEGKNLVGSGTLQILPDLSLIHI